MVQINRKNRDRRGGHLSDGFFDDEGCWMTTPNQRKFAKGIKARATRQSVKDVVRAALVEMIEDKEIEAREQAVADIEDDNFYAHMQDYVEPYDDYAASDYNDDDYFEDYDMSQDYSSYYDDGYDRYLDTEYYDALCDISYVPSYPTPRVEEKSTYQDSGESLGDILLKALLSRQNS